MEGESKYVPDVDVDEVIGPAGRKFGTKSYLCVPIKRDNTTIGVLGIASLVKNAYDHDELELLEIVAHQIETALNNAGHADELKELYHELSNRNNDLEILNTISETVHKFHDLEQVYQKALDMIELSEDIDMAAIYIVDKQNKEAVLQGHKNLPDGYVEKASRIPYPKGATWKIIKSGKILNIEDAMNHPDIGSTGSLLGHHGMLGMPITFEDETIGVVWFGSYKQKKFGEQEVELLSSIGTQIATAVAKANLYSDLLIKNRYESIISSVIRSIHQSIDLQEVLENAVESLIENVDRLDIASIYLVEGNEAVLKAHRGYDNKFLKRAAKIPYPKGATWKTIKEGKCRYVPDIDSDSSLGQAGRDLGMKSYLSAPIRSYGNVVGTLNMVSFQKDAFDTEEIKLLETVAGQIEIAINNAQQAESLIQSQEALRQNYDQLSKKNIYETISGSVLRTATESVELQKVLDNAVEAMSKNIEQANIVEVYIIDGTNAVLKSQIGYKKSYIKKAGSIPHPKGFIWKTAIDEKPIYCADTDTDTIIGQAGREAGIKSYLSMPIRYEGKVFGVIGINSFQKEAFDKEELRLLETVAEQIELAINNTQRAEALRQSEERYRILFDQSPMGVFISDNQLIITQCNTKMEELLQTSREKMIGLDMRKLKDTSFVPAMEKALEGESAFHESYYEATTSSAKLWLSLCYSPLYNGDGVVIGGIGIVQDITERKHAELEMAENKSMLLSTFNSMTNAVIATDSGGSITFMNAVAEEYAGCPQDNVINKKLDRILKFRDIEAGKLVKIPKDIYSEADSGSKFPKRAILIGKNQEQKTVDIEISSLHDEMGKISGSLFIINEAEGHGAAASNGSDVYSSEGSVDDSSPAYSLVIAASSLLILEGMNRILEPVNSINVLATTSHKQEVLPLLKEYRPDVLFFDSSLPGPNLKEILNTIEKHKLTTKVLVHSPDEASIIEAISLGVRGCIVELSDQSQLIQAIRTVGKGEIWMDVGLVTNIITNLLPEEKTSANRNSSELTQKEEEIAHLVAQGLSNKQISTQLFISEITVKTHLRNIFKKVDIRSRYELVKKFGS